LRPGDIVTIPANHGFPKDRRQPVDRNDVVIAVHGPIAMTRGRMFVPMYNPKFVATGQRDESVEIPTALRQSLLELGWEVLGGSTSTETSRG
jgi:hypothetical protein